MDLNALCDLAIHAAQRGGAIIKQSYTSDFIVEHKAVGASMASQVVTEVDRQAQQAILEILAPSVAAYDLAVLAEESVDDRQRLEKPAFWSIDPLDGTLAFIEKKPGFAVSIALVSQAGTPLLGVIYNPIGDDLYQAIHGHGAFLNGAAFAAAPLASVDKNAPLVLTTDPSFVKHPWFEQTRQGLARIAEKLGLSGADIDYKTGGVMNACAILRQPNLCYFKYPRNTESGGSLWDYAATACLFHEAHGLASDMYGNPMELNRRGSTFMNHQGILYAADKRLAEEIMGLYHGLKGK